MINSAIIQHLAIRRMIWEPPTGNESAPTNFQVFQADDTPTVSDILNKANGNAIEMVAILQSLLLNTPASRLKVELSSASIDVSGIVHSIRSLNEFHPSKYPIDQVQLRNLKALM
ncbi:MAG: hypothetical protein U5J62_05445 [Desulfurivibrio sp.]|nr:hypothetical protein [Desulfurivibrio sp.]